MASTQGICNVFKEALLGGSAIAMASDTLKVGLYNSSASLGPSTTNYSSTDEISGTGYTAGGATLSGLTTGVSSNTAWVSWSNPSWTSSTLSGRGADLRFNR